MRPRNLSSSLRYLQLQQLDRRIRDMPDVIVPRGGWLRVVRSALGLSQSQLARRMGTTQQAVDRLEKAEVARTVTLARLVRAADALGGRVVYAIVPEGRNSFEEMLRFRARAVAKNIVDRAEHTMALEAQSGHAEDHERDIAELADELFRTFSAEIWSSDEAR